MGNTDLSEILKLAYKLKGLDCDKMVMDIDHAIEILEKLIGFMEQESE